MPPQKNTKPTGILTTIQEVLSVLKEISDESESRAAYITFYDDGSGKIGTGFDHNIANTEVLSFGNVEKIKVSRKKMSLTAE